MAQPNIDWLCRHIVQNTADGIIFANRDGIIQLWNSGAELLFGYQAAEAIGQTLDLIIPDKLRGRHWDGYHKVMETGVTRYGKELLAVPAVRKDGTRISLEFSIVLVQDDAGRPVGTAAIIRDVTARWQQERATKERVAALEGNKKGAEG